MNTSSLMGADDDTSVMVDPVYTPDEVAEMLKLKTPRTVQKWLRDGKLKGFKAGKEWRITESALNEFMKEGGAD